MPSQDHPLAGSPNATPIALMDFLCMDSTLYAGKPNPPAPTCSLPRYSPAGPIHLLERGWEQRGRPPLPPASLAPSLRASG